MFTSPSNTIVTKSPTNSFSPQNPSLQTLTDSTIVKTDEIKGVHNDSSILSPNTTTGSAKGTLNTPISTDYGKTPQAVADPGDLSSSPLTRRVIKNHPGHHQTRRQRFNIITGHPLQLEPDPTPTLEPNPSFTSSLNKINFSDLNSSNSTTGPGVSIEANATAASTEQLQKAPHLDMRRNRFQNSSFSGLSTYRASFKPTPGFYSSTVGSATAVPSAANPWDHSSSMIMNYSRHSTVVHNLKASKGAPLSSGLVVSTGSDSSLVG